MCFHCDMLACFAQDGPISKETIIWNWTILSNNSVFFIYYVWLMVAHCTSSKVFLWYQTEFTILSFLNACSVALCGWMDCYVEQDTCITLEHVSWILALYHVCKCIPILVFMQSDQIHFMWNGWCIKVPNFSIQPFSGREVHGIRAWCSVSRSCKAADQAGSGDASAVQKFLKLRIILPSRLMYV